MFNAAIDSPPHCYWNDIMSSHCPPGYRGCEAKEEEEEEEEEGVCAVLHLFVRLCVPVRVFSSRRFQSNSTLSDGDKSQSGPGHLAGNYQHTCHIHSSSCSSRNAPSLRHRPDWDLDRGARGTFDPLLPLSFLYLPPCWLICALALSSHPPPPPQPTLHLLLLLSGIGEGSIWPHAGSQLALHTYWSVSAGYWRSSRLLHSRAECV